LSRDSRDKILGWTESGTDGAIGVRTVLRRAPRWSDSAAGSPGEYRCVPRGRPHASSTVMSGTSVPSARR